jgi:hypothetical protein
MKKINYGFAAILLMLGVACRKVPNVSCNSPTSDPSLAKELLIGKWQLERTFIAARRIGKLSKSRDQLPYVILTFSNDLTFQCFIADTLSSKGKFEFVKDGNTDLLTFQGGDLTFIDGVAPFKICNDSLYLNFNSYMSDIVPDQVWNKK